MAWYRRTSSIIFLNSGSRFSEGAVFELIKDGHHHHLICLECGQTQCVEICPINKEVIGVLEDNQFEMSGHTFEIYGHCKSCRQKI